MRGARAHRLLLELNANYIGKVCIKHPELGGERRNGNCPACQRERPKPKRSRESQRAKVKKWREANREHNLLAGTRRSVDDAKKAVDLI